MATTVSYLGTAKSFAGGTAGVAGQGQTYLVQFNNAFSVTDAYQFDIVTAAQTFSVGTGDLFAQSISGNTFNIWQGLWYNNLYPVSLLTMDEKMYSPNGTGFSFSALDNPTLWNSQQDAGSGSIDTQNVESTPEPMRAFSVYQGFLSVFMRFSIQIWQVNADPTLYTRQQTLENIGTVAPLSPQGIGELDVIFLSDTGFRSLRVRDSSLNAFVTDVGSAVDSLVMADFIAIGGASNAALSPAIVEPQSNRYWCFLNNKIYVLSYFPASKIVAWGIYNCTFNDPINGNGQTFTPQKMVIFQGQVYVLAQSQAGATVVLLYGGTNNNTYDQTVAQVETPWLDARSPGTVKTARGIDAGLSGSWTFGFGVDYIDESTTSDPTVYTQPTYDYKRIGVSGQGTHFRITASSVGSGPCVLGTLLIHYEPGDEK